jgi:hypothetical protein
MLNFRFIPISKYLQISDVDNQSIPLENRFYFSVNNQASFFVYKSLACFLSSETSKCLLVNKTEFKIQNEDLNYDPNVLKNYLIELLTGFPIIIHQLNFHFFQKVFKYLGNIDFATFFEGCPPDFEYQFFLSINSLQNVPFENIENETFHPSALPDFSIPLDFVHLFWNTPKEFQENIFKKYKQVQIYDCTYILNQLKKGFLNKITQDQKSFFQLHSIHLGLLNDLSESFPIKLAYFKNRKYENSHITLASIYLYNSTQTDNIIEKEIIYLKEQQQSVLKKIKKFENKNQDLSKQIITSIQTNLLIQNDNKDLKEHEQILLRKIKKLKKTKYRYFSSASKIISNK